MGGGGRDRVFFFGPKKSVSCSIFFELCTKNRFFFAGKNIDFCADS